MRFQKKSPQQNVEGITTEERVHSQPCGKRSQSIHNFTFISSDFAFAICMEEALQTEERLRSLSSLNHGDH
jgi:hypothetical protein